MKRYNHTGVTHEITYCVSEHWQAHGEHSFGDYGDCVPKTVSVPPGGEIAYDALEDNGAHITSLLDDKGFD